MTQTGSMGLISAASPRHPRPYALMMGIFKGLHKSPGLVCGVAQCPTTGCLNNRAHTSPTATITRAPPTRLKPTSLWEKVKP